MTRMNEYLTESARTAPTEVSVRNDVFKNHLGFMYDLNMFVESGCNADLLKRSIFYKEEIAKTQARGYAHTLNNKKNYDEIQVQLLAEEKEEDVTKHKTLTDEKIHLIHACLGLISEAGEIIEEVIKSTLEGRDIDYTNLKEEGGDTLWYIAMYLRTLGTTFEEQADSNIAKLFARYPDKFTSEAALNRDLNNEREVLEKQTA